MTIRIRSHSNAAEARELSAILRNYIDFLREDLEHHFGFAFDPDAFHAEAMAHLDAVTPPAGCCLSASNTGDAPVGMVFLRRIRPDAVEVKRLYVRPEGRGQGIARRLLARVEEEARAMNARWIYLDSTRNLESAIALYASLGFQATDPFPESDVFRIPELAPHAVFMRKEIQGP